MTETTPHYFKEFKSYMIDFTKEMLKMRREFVEFKDEMSKSTKDNKIWNMMISEQITVATNRIKDVEEELKEVKEDINSHKSTTFGLREDIGNLGDKIEGMSKRIDTHFIRTDATMEKVGDLDHRTKTLEDKVFA